MSQAATLTFAVAVHGAPYASPAARNAWAFTRAALAAGHRVPRVFFYHDGVQVADALAVPPQDEPDLRAAWQALQRDHRVELAVCIAAALKRGVLNDEEQARYDAPAASLAEGFEIVGLGQYVEALMAADRSVTFAA